MLPQAQRMGDAAQPGASAPHKLAPAAPSVVVGGFYKLPADEVVDPLRAQKHVTGSVSAWLSQQSMAAGSRHGSSTVLLSSLPSKGSCAPRTAH